MSNIITHIEFAELKNIISKKYDTEKVEKSINEAQLDLREVIGDAFFFDVIKNKDTAEYSDLFEGSEFIKDDFTMYHEGLKSLVADYAYARYLYEINVNHSPFGMVGKNSQDSTPVDRNVIRDLVKQANQDASRKWELIKDYLNESRETFTVWSKQQEGCGVNNNSSGFNSTKFSFLSTGK